MLYPQPGEQAHQTSPTFNAFGQTWQFTRQAISALHLYGMGSPRALKAIVVNLGSAKGIPPGTHDVDHLGVSLRLIVRGDQVTVDDPYYYDRED